MQRPRTPVFSVLPSLLLGAALAGQTWQPLNITTPPHGPAATLFPDLGAVGTPISVQFEEGTGTNAGTLWGFSSGMWNPMLAPGGPVPRTFSGMAGGPGMTLGPGFVLLGGLSATPPTQPLNDAWTVVTAGWQQLPSLPGPARFGHAMTAVKGPALPPTPATVFVHGGADFNTAFADFFQFFNGVWSPVVFFGNSPPGRLFHTLTQGPDNTLVLFGGAVPPSTRLGDTWIFDLAARTWTQLPLTAVAPPARSNAAAVFDPGRPMVVLHGGLDTAGTTLTDTWEWDGIKWRQVGAAGTPSGTGEAMFFDPLAARVFATSSGTNLQTHRFDPSPAGFVTTPDLWTCSASGGAPLLLEAPNRALPIIGQTFLMTVTGVSSTGILFGGFEFPGARVPLPLGCTCDRFLTGGPASGSVFIPNLGSTTPFPLLIANNQALLGVTIDIQVFLFDNSTCPIKTTPLGMATLGN